MKVGIVTHYYKSRNYGGNLQAYALCKYLNSLPDVSAEQICYCLGAVCRRRPPFSAKLVSYYFKRFFEKSTEAVRCRVYKKQDAEAALSVAAIDRFNASVPHSDIVYTADTVASANDVYDAFITGSDQVWNPNVFCTGYLLSFVADNKLKLSYAASVSRDELSDGEKDVFRNSLTGYDGISVREASAVRLLAPLTETKIIQTADPVFLLDRHQWDELCIEDTPTEKYMLCYFLGNSISHRRTARDTAKKMGLKAVSIPDLLGKYRKCDRVLGGELLYGVTVEKLLSLIKNAEYVITDSYHVSAFCHIFQKQFAVFGRNESGASMNSRLCTLLEQTGTPERLLNKKSQMNAEYIMSLGMIDHSVEPQGIAELKRISVDYLNSILFQGQN